MCVIQLHIYSTVAKSSSLQKKTATVHIVSPSLDLSLSRSITDTHTQPTQKVQIVKCPPNTTHSIRTEHYIIISYAANNVHHT